MPVHYHDEPEIAELMKLAEEYPEVWAACRLVCNDHEVGSIPRLFDVNPEAAFELAEEMRSMIEQTTSDDGMLEFAPPPEDEGWTDAMRQRVEGS